MADLRDLIKQYLTEAKLMQLATSVNDQPWACSVWFAADDDLNIYWFSSTTRRHSKEVLQNPKVGGAIALPQTPADDPRGLQFEGTAKLLEDEGEVRTARSHYAGRIFSDEQIDQFTHHPEKPHRFYRVTPKKFVLFDVVNFPDESRQELNL